MAKIGQVRGVILEEILLYLLRGTGYRTVEDTDSDPTLQNGPGGLEVKGRGGWHQIDAIADAIFNHPFTNPHRLLVEAKCYQEGDRVGLPEVRNAVGVLKDVSEHWALSASSAKSRYHYQFAMFSSSGYSPEAEEYAFAQDIYLIPLASSAYFSPIIEGIRGITASSFGVGPNADINLSLRDFRRQIRRLRDLGITTRWPRLDTPREGIFGQIGEFFARIDSVILAVVGGGFPILLVPSPQTKIGLLQDEIRVRIYWDNFSWYLTDENNRMLFSFDLPSRLFSLYDSHGILEPRRALDLKEETMYNFYAIKTVEGRPKLIRFQLDASWLQTVRSHLK